MEFRLQQTFPIRKNRYSSVLLAVLALFLVAYTSLAAEVTLAWDPSPSPEVVSYRVYVGTAPRSYDSTIDVGGATSATVSNLLAGTTYYFAVTASDTFGLESDFSEELVYTPEVTIDTPPRIKIRPGAGYNKISGTGAPGVTYLIQASVDMAGWSDIGVVTSNEAGEFEYDDPIDQTVGLKLYRVEGRGV